MKMQKYSYKLETLSSLIISPRSSFAFYEGIDFIQEDIDSKGLKDYVNYEVLKKLKIIYPFYQYSSYEKYDPINADYYIPGSSIKGAIILNRDIHLMVDDIPLSNSQVTLDNIYKVQYLKSRKNDDDPKTTETEDSKQSDSKQKKAIHDPFFDYIGIEMVKKGITLDGEFITDQNPGFLDAANGATEKKLGNLETYIERILQLDIKDITAEIKINLKKTVENLKNVRKNGITSNKEFIILIGGYKGLLLSIEKKEEVAKKDTLDDLVEENGGVYLDPQTHLPYGLVKLKLTDES